MTISEPDKFYVTNIKIKTMVYITKLKQHSNRVRRGLVTLTVQFPELRLGYQASGKLFTKSGLEIRIVVHDVLFSPEEYHSMHSSQKYITTEFVYYLAISIPSTHSTLQSKAWLPL